MIKFMGMIAVFLFLRTIMYNSTHNIGDSYVRKPILIVFSVCARTKWGMHTDLGHPTLYASCKKTETSLFVTPPKNSHFFCNPCGIQLISVRLKMYGPGTSANTAASPPEQSPQLQQGEVNIIFGSYKESCEHFA